MTALAHLPLLRFTREEPRRKKPGFSSAVTRDIPAHARRLKSEVRAIVADFAKRPHVSGIDPALVLKVELTSPIDEDVWRRTGFQVLAQNSRNILILFSSDTELKKFSERLSEFSKGNKVDGGNAAYFGLFSNIEHALPIPSEDRIGPRLRAQGITSSNKIDGRKSFVVDIEIWDAKTEIDSKLRAYRIEQHVKKAAGEIIGAPYIGSYGLILIRAQIKGKLLQSLLELNEIALIDLPPLPDIGDDKLSEQTLDTIPNPTPPLPNAPVIGVIDSGLNAHPLIDGVVIDRIAIPPSLGTGDMKGHGTMVAGIAAYGDIRECIDENTFASPVRILSVRVVNDNGKFDDILKIPEIMHAAVSALVERGCRIVNISLGDASHVPYSGGRATPWAAEIDTLAREFDILIVVAAGNSNPTSPPWGADAEAIIKTYPSYLTAPENRLIDPAIAANAITVGAIAHGNGLRNDVFDGVQVRSVTVAGDPTPITRVGPGINDAIKPDFVDYGGTVVYNGSVRRIMTGKDWTTAGMLSLGQDYRSSLFTAATGTSFAAPRVAYKAGLILARYPDISSALIRALLAISADMPEQALNRLVESGLDREKVSGAARNFFGYGIPDHNRALASEERRVVFVADRQTLELDQMALYAIPLPREFRSTPGKREIRVALAFDAPVRHTRYEYLGVRMSFYLVRGLTPDAIFDHFKRREDRTKPPKLPSSAKCDLVPSISDRQACTLQAAKFSISRNFDDSYGTEFYLAVFTHRRWAGEDIQQQEFAITVELLHENCTTIHQSCASMVLELNNRIELGA